VKEKKKKSHFYHESLSVEVEHAKELDNMRMVQLSNKQTSQGQSEKRKWRGSHDKRAISCSKPIEESFTSFSATGVPFPSRRRKKEREKG
jgi:hypothetical protein